MSTKKKNEKVFSTPQEEITFLKRQVAGQKGQMGLLLKKISDLDKCTCELLDERIAKNKTIAGLESQVSALKETITERNDTIKTLKSELTAVNAQYEYFYALPWYKRIFFKG